MKEDGSGCEPSLRLYHEYVSGAAASGDIASPSLTSRRSRLNLAQFITTHRHWLDCSPHPQKLPCMNS